MDECGAEKMDGCGAEKMDDRGSREDDAARIVLICIYLSFVFQITFWIGFVIIDISALNCSQVTPIFSDRS